MIQKDNKMVCTVGELAQYLCSTIVNKGKNRRALGIETCDFCLTEDYGKNIKTYTEMAAGGWYGIKVMRPGFNSKCLILIADYYGGGCAAMCQLRADGLFWLKDLERLLLDSLSYNEIATTRTLLYVELKGVTMK